MSKCEKCKKPIPDGRHTTCRPCRTVTCTECGKMFVPVRTGITKLCTKHQLYLRERIASRGGE